jgi:NADPH-dependent curcumin reductase CurA
MTTAINRQILLVSRPAGMPDDSNFRLIESSVPSISDNEVLIRTLWLSVDPYMRGRMRDAKSYAVPFALNEVIYGGMVGEVIESSNTDFAVGDIVEGRLGWADYNVSNGQNIRKIDPNVAPISTALHVLGMPGLTAYFGLLEIGKPQEGETVVVSGAAGAVGTIVGQIAKLKGCRVVGIAGSEEKISYLKDELGFDEVINYKTTPDIRKALAAACPKGVDVYFDNVGGDITDSVMTLINFQARLIICGQISLYNLEKPDLGPRLFPLLLMNSATAKGFIVSDYAAQNKEALSQLTEWVTQGKLKYQENVVEGLENTPRAFFGLFKGENLGKQLVKVAE